MRSLPSLPSLARRSLARALPYAASSSSCRSATVRPPSLLLAFVVCWPLGGEEEEEEEKEKGKEDRRKEEKGERGKDEGRRSLGLAFESGQRGPGYRRCRASPLADTARAVPGSRAPGATQESPLSAAVKREGCCCARLVLLPRAAGPALSAPGCRCRDNSLGRLLKLNKKNLGGIIRFGLVKLDRVGDRGPAPLRDLLQSGYSTNAGPDLPAL